MSKRNKKFTLTAQIAALRYAKKGIPVIAVHGIVEGACTCSAGAKCTAPGKHPAFSRGVRDGTTDQKRLRKHFRAHPDHNVAICVGRTSNLLVLDIDKGRGGFRTLKAQLKALGPLPDLVVAHTGGDGRHYFFKHPKFQIRRDTTGKVFGPGIDVLGEDSYVIVPPSRHASGGRYLWPKGRSFSSRAPSSLPKLWRKALRDGAKPAKDAKARSNRHEDLKDADILVPTGERNSHLTRFAGKLHRISLNRDAIANLLEIENRTKCQPPLPTEELEKIVASVSRYPAAPSETGDAAEEIYESPTITLLVDGT